MVSKLERKSKELNPNRQITPERKAERKNNNNKLKKKKTLEGFPGDSVAKTPHSQCREPRFNPLSGSSIPTCHS